MPVFQWGQGWSPFENLEHHVERLLANVRLAMPTVRVDRPYPQVNLWEDETCYLLVAGVPGVSAESLDLTVSDGMLTIRGERIRPEGVGDEYFRRHERLWGPWERSFTLPDRIMSDQITAEIVDGILKVRIPRQRETPVRQIPVTTIPVTGTDPQTVNGSLPPAEEGR